MKIELPKKVLFIINNLQLHGYEAFAVGGCVRDSILARRPQDWDITTSAKPEEIKKLFRRTIDTRICVYANLPKNTLLFVHLGKIL